MLKKTITFNDLDGNPLTEDFYFALTEAEVAELELRYNGLANRLEKMTEPPIDGGLVMDTFKDMIARSVGKRHEDNVQFIKNDEVRGRFMQSDAYTKFFMELVTDAEAGSKFVNGIMPAIVQEKLAQGKPLTDVPLPGPDEKGQTVQDAVTMEGSEQDETPRARYERLLVDPNWRPSKKDIIAMDKDQMTRAFGRKLADGDE